MSVKCSYISLASKAELSQFEDAFAPPILLSTLPTPAYPLPIPCPCPSFLPPPAAPAAALHVCPPASTSSPGVLARRHVCCGLARQPVLPV